MTQMLLFTLFLKTERKLNCSWGFDPRGSCSDLSWGFREIKQRKWQFLGWLDHAIIHALVRSPRLRPRWSHPPSFSPYARTRITKFGFKAYMIFWFERHVIPDGSGEIKRTKQWREIHTLKIHVNCKLIFICFYAQFSPLSTLFWTCFVSLQRTSVPPRPKYLV